MHEGFVKIQGAGGGSCAGLRSAPGWMSDMDTAFWRDRMNRLAAFFT